MTFESPPSYIAQCEKARQSTKNFVRILKILHEQYEKLWKENLEITKYIEKSDNRVCQQCSNCLIKKKEKIGMTPTFDEDKENKSTELNVSQNVTEQSLRDEEITSNESLDPETHFTDFELNLKGDKCNKEKHSSPTKIEQLKSPVISKRHRKYRSKDNKTVKKCVENTSTNDIFSDMDFEEAMCSVSEAIECQESSIEECSIQSDTKDKIQKIIDKKQDSLKLSVSTLYVGETEFLHDGRKLKQSKLVLKPVKPKTEVSCFTECNDLNVNEWKEAILDIKTSPDITNNERHNRLEEWPDTVQTTPIQNCSKLKSKFTQSLKTSNAAQKSFDQKEDYIPTSDMRTDSLGHYNFTENLTSKNIQCTPKKSPLNKLCNSEMFIATDNNDDIESTFFIEPNGKHDFDIADNNVVSEVASGEAEQHESLQKNSTEEENLSNTLDDTFFSPEERARNNKVEEFKIQKSKKRLLDDYDIIPEKKKSSPNHPYKERTVRNKAERAKLEGWECWECEEFYKGMGYTEEELKRYRKLCSRHKAKYNTKYSTPEGFWNPQFSDSLNFNGNAL